MEMVKVESSNVKSVGWFNNVLFVEYPAGTYIYLGVIKSIFEKLLNAPSKGKFMNTEIKGKFEYKKI